MKRNDHRQLLAKKWHGPLQPPNTRPDPNFALPLRSPPLPPSHAHLTPNSNRHTQPQLATASNHQPPAPRAVRDRQQQPRQPTETELSLVDKFFEDPAEGALWKIQAVAWDDEAGQMAAYAVRIRKLRKGHYAVAQKKGVPMEPVAIEEAQEWVANSHLLNRALAPGEY